MYDTYTFIELRKNFEDYQSQKTERTENIQFVTMKEAVEAYKDARESEVFDS